MRSPRSVALQINPHHAVASNNLGAVRLNTYRPLQAGQQFSAALRSDPSLEIAKGNLALLLRRGLVTATALSLIAVLLLSIGLENEVDSGSRTWRTAVGAACFSVLLFVTRGTAPSSVHPPLLRTVLLRRLLHQVLTLVAVASSANALLIPVLPRSLALNLAYTHLGLAVLVVPSSSRWVWRPQSCAAPADTAAS